MSSTRCRSLYGEIPPQSSPNIRKTGNNPPGHTISSHGKQGGAPRSTDTYNTQTWIWKVDHPSFFDFFSQIGDDGGSRLDGGPFSPSGSGGIVSQLPGDDDALPQSGIHHSSRPDPENNPGRCRKECDTTCTGFDATTKQTPAFGLAIPRKQAYPTNFSVGLPGLVVQKKGPKCQLRAFCLLLFSIKPKFYQKPEPNPKQKRFLQNVQDGGLTRHPLTVHAPFAK